MSSEDHVFNAADLLTSIRIAAALALIFAKVLSPLFFAIYILAAITDILDGFTARRTHTESEFGKKLDTVADIILVLVCMIKLFPALSIPKWLWAAAAVIFLIKLSNIIGGYIKYGCFVSEHSILNKLTGVLLFLVPLSINIIPIKISSIPVLIIALIAAVHEGYLIYKA